MIIASSFPRTGSLYVLVSRTVHPILGYLPFWYFIIGGGAATVSGFILFIGIKAMAGALTVAGFLVRRYAESRKTQEVLRDLDE